ncbi:hypothetical protein NDU88_001906 [Pleurodeles waltl]|uniref:Uncharacterized protein n=1 Tax=Pleurodeles waltl TaxID=8319 RepID=A0AAV7U9S2_PLEWA|nr:hypothetical protein NDU88_001906 [Pleurodeles waltl]
MLGVRASPSRRVQMSRGPHALTCSHQTPHVQLNQGARAVLEYHGPSDTQSCGVFAAYAPSLSSVRTEPVQEFIGLLHAVQSGTKRLVKKRRHMNMITIRWYAFRWRLPKKNLDLLRMHSHEMMVDDTSPYASIETGRLMSRKVILEAMYHENPLGNDPACIMRLFVSAV